MRRLMLALLLAFPCALVPVGVVVAAGGNPLSASAGTYYVTQINEGAVARVDVSSSGVVTVVQHYITGLPTSGPDSAVFAGDGSMLVSNFSDGTISRVDVNARRVVTLQVNNTKLPNIADLAADPNGNYVWAIGYSGVAESAIARVDLNSGQTVIMNPDKIGNTGGITFNLDGSRLFIASHDGYVAEVDPHTGHIVRKVQLDGEPDGMTFDPQTGHAFASGCRDGVCELDTNNNSLRLVRVLKSANGDGIAADGNGHLYLANSCAALCRIDLATDQAIAVTDEVSSADDVTPLVGAGSAAGTSCKTLGSCFDGGVAAGVAAASVGVVVFLGAAGFNVGTPGTSGLGGSPAPAGAHALGGAHAVTQGAVPAAAPAHAISQATTGAHAGAHAAASGSGAERLDHLGPHPHSSGGEASGATETSHLQEEAGDKLLEAGGAGVEHGVDQTMLPVVEEEEAEAEAGATAGELGGVRMGRDDDEGDAPAPPPVPEPPPLAPPDR